MSKRKKILVANWKMNHTLREVTDFAKAIQAANIPVSNTAEYIIAPAFPFIQHLHNALVSSPIQVAAQNCATEANGAYTGEVAANMLQSVGASYVLIGHSERREYYFEDVNILKKKIQQALDNELIPIICCGESLEIRESEKHLQYVTDQLADCLQELAPSKMNNIIIAYEPIWAIGTGKTATCSQVEEMHTHIRQYLEKTYGQSTAEEIPLLYGGSCNQKNAAELFAISDVDGGLIGSASLKADSFLELIDMLQA